MEISKNKNDLMKSGIDFNWIGYSIPTQTEYRRYGDGRTRIRVCVQGLRQEYMVA